MKLTSAVNTSFHLSSLSLTVEFSPELATALNPEPEVINLPSSPFKGDADPDHGMVVEALGSTGDHDRDSTRDISEDEADQGIEESDLDSESWLSATNCDQGSVTGDCLMCLDTEKAALKSACKKFHKGGSLLQSQ